MNFIDAAHGNALISENDLDLVDRPLKMGTPVKRHPDDTISGTVISISKKCTLEPIVSRECDSVTGESGPLNFSAKNPFDTSSPPKETDAGRLLHDVPLSDIRYFEEFAEGDYIVYQQKVGFVLEVMRDAILFLPNKTAVSIEDPLMLHRPLSAGMDDLVSKPSPGALRANPLRNGTIFWSLEAPDFYPGDFILTTKHALRTGNWISGSFSNSERAGGHVIATPAFNICVGWLCPNTFAPGEPFHGPDTDNFRPSTLRQHAVKCDFGKLPGNSNDKTPKTDIWYSSGDKVRFRDPAKAAAKYPQYQHIPANQTFGYDLNMFRMVSTKSEFTVRWQDLSVTVEDPASLHRFAGSRDEFWPGNLVALRDEVQSTPMPRGMGHGVGPAAGPFDGCQCHMLTPKKIGVVQTVDSRERIASVSWYKQPNVQLLHCGNMLRPTSTLGELGDQPTDVSLYELTTFPSLGRELDDFVLLPPEKVHQSLMASSNPNISSAATGPCVLSMLSPLTFPKTCAILHSIRTVLVGTDWFKISTAVDTTPLPSRHSIQPQKLGLRGPPDFVGRIISVDVDGTVTVRLAALDKCRDVRVPLGKILMVIDFERALFPLALPGMDDIDVLSPFGPVGGIGPIPPGPVPTGPMPPPPFVDTDDEVLEEFLATGRTDRVIDPEIEYRLDDDDPWETEDELDDDAIESEFISDEDDIDDLEDSDEDEHVDDANASRPGVTEIRSDVPGSDEDESKPGDSPDSAGGDEGTSKNAPPPSDEKAKPGFSFNQSLSCPDSFAVLESDPPSDHRFHSIPASEASGVRIKRIRKEYEILGSSLPPGIFVRSWESRIDLFRVLIIGPQGTPYEYAPFVIDFHFPDSYPNTPPASFFHSWTNGLGMINPNLYEDGKICLSILGTWPGKDADEGWSSIKSTVLQVLVSIMGLVLVKAPFYSMTVAPLLCMYTDSNRRSRFRRTSRRKR